MRTLEELPGRKLLVRTRSGASLASAGSHFLRYTQTLVQDRERARQQVAVPPDRHAVVTEGGKVSLWDPMLRDWLLWLRRAAPQLALRAVPGLPECLIPQVVKGILDIAVIYEPRKSQVWRVSC